MIVYEVLYYTENFTPDTPYKHMRHFMSRYTGRYPVTANSRNLYQRTNSMRGEVDFSIYLENPILKTPEEQLISQMKYGHPYGEGDGLIRVMEEEYVGEQEVLMKEYLEKFIERNKII